VEQTAARFVEHAGRRWYRPGDLGRYWPDGTLEFLGRADSQVKVRGHRIELGEIETTLQAHPHIHHAVAGVTTHGGRKLAAAIVREESIGSSNWCLELAHGEGSRQWAVGS
jgi:yersiniabactin nonribosomal peptide synthetase